ncbi:IS1 family transposase [Rhizobium ruizarguesonis]|uniref:IS1 family transposase n=1 Tax=Rhizobium ruizarguesonis TaxID=2081791 RepID=UPI001031743E|nr:IS1 family transposase [Rhizobium ruizarguesonis]TBB75457.1 IS1 family transposase [Rhizobium ruizarguesonis]
MIDHDLFEDEEIRCPACNREGSVKNGFVRGTQRYLCRPCNKNFAAEFKRRWPTSSKLLNLMLYCGGETLEAVSEGCGASPSTVDRWQTEAREHHSWFVRGIAEQAVYEFERGPTIEECLSHAMGTYAFITGRDLDGASGTFNGRKFAQSLIEELATIGSSRLLEALGVYLETLPANSIDP